MTNERKERLLDIRKCETCDHTVSHHHGDWCDELQCACKAWSPNATEACPSGRHDPPKSYYDPADVLAQAPHACPFKRELHDDLTECRCCVDCTDTCRRDV